MTAANEPELRSVAFTLTIDKQDGRRFSETFSSARGGSKVVAVISRSGTIFLADAEGFSNGPCWRPTGWSSAISSTGPRRGLPPAWN
jgi:hypothetical protein